jgi:NAD(P)-dependent dehydrogenase (short-subunit alcohol dehydrogenase family)
MDDQSKSFLGSLHDCYFETDPRINTNLAKQLSGKNVVIAGAGRGIGRACAELLSNGRLGSLSITALEKDEIDETARICKCNDPDLRIKTGAFNVQDAPAVKQFLLEVDREFDGLDVVLMNAGRPPQWFPTAEGDPEIWWDTVGVSLRGAYNFSRYALPIMQKKRDGRIIFTSSAGAHANQGISSYITAKLAMVRLAEIIHVENFKDHNIKAFAIHPSAIQTRFYHDFKDKAEGRTKARSYIVAGAEGEDKSAQAALKFLDQGTFDTPYMAAGMVSVLSTGQLDFLSGRYVDCSTKVEEYLEQHDSIIGEDLYRIRLNSGNGRLIPLVDF